MTVIPAAFVVATISLAGPEVSCAAVTFKTVGIPAASVVVAVPIAGLNTLGARHS